MNVHSSTLRAALLLTLVLAAPARGDETSFAVDRFQLDPGAGAVLRVAGARVAAPGVTASFGAHWANRLLELERPGSRTALVGSTFASQLSAAVAFRERWEVGAALPFAVARSTGSGGLHREGAGSGTGDLRVVPKVALPDVGRYRFAAMLPLTLPTASGPLLGDGGVTVAPAAAAETELGRVRVAGNLGVALRPERRFHDLQVGSAVVAGAGAELPFRARGARWAALASVSAELGLAAPSSAASPAELDAAIRWEGPRGLDLTAGVGTALVDGYGAPGARVFVLVGSGRARAVAVVAADEAPPPVEPPPVAPAAAPAAPPPEPVVTPPPPPPPPPPEPQIPPAPPPPPDPCAPGEAHAPEQCPALDDDDDGVANADDRCPRMAGEAAHAGCQAPKAVLNEATKKIEIKEAVFFEKSEAKIDPRSFGLLDDVARVLAENPQVRRVSIEGHTDDRGGAELNRKLSEQRAGAVRAYLVSKGVAEGRLAAKGFGPSRPIADNATPTGRSMNRRVEFLVE
jgi:outer membrane protein OmpA-like peptidoglycan-associated protein